MAASICLSKPFSASLNSTTQRAESLAQLVGDAVQALLVGELGEDRRRLGLEDLLVQGSRRPRGMWLVDWHRNRVGVG